MVLLLSHLLCLFVFLLHLYFLGIHTRVLAMIVKHLTQLLLFLMSYINKSDFIRSSHHPYLTVFSSGCFPITVKWWMIRPGGLRHSHGSSDMLSSLCVVSTLDQDTAESPSEGKEGDPLPQSLNTASIILQHQSVCALKGQVGWIRWSVPILFALFVSLSPFLSAEPAWTTVPLSTMTNNDKPEKKTNNTSIQTSYFIFKRRQERSIAEQTSLLGLIQFILYLKHTGLTAPCVHLQKLAGFADGANWKKVGKRGKHNSIVSDSCAAAFQPDTKTRPRQWDSGITCPPSTHTHKDII